MRKNDIIGRLGGEEFGIAMAGAAQEDAHKVFKRLKRMVENTCVEVEEGSIYYTISVGYVWSDCHEPFDELYANADEALGNAKALGKNRIIEY